VSQMPGSALPFQGRVALCVCGIKGGVGTTTVASLIAGTLGLAGPPVLVSDHSGGSISERVVDSSVSDRFWIHDAGSVAFPGSPIFDWAVRWKMAMVLVASSEDEEAVDEVLSGFQPAEGVPSARPAPTALVVTMIHNRTKPQHLLELVDQRYPWVRPLVMSYDKELALRGKIVRKRVRAENRATIDTLVAGVATAAM